ncbi:MAG: ABC transporter permease [Bacteroidetes bacterium]|nr:ABC transporter permease [Bacteroidota bacterium]
MYVLGKYIIFIKDTLVNRQSLKTYVNRTFSECVLIGLHSVFIIFFISIALGVVSSLQTISTLRNNIFFADSLLGFGIRDITIAELAPTVTVLIFSGRIGSSIAGEIGAMKITEQIDALEAMGINAKSYLVLPKILACLLMYPLLVIMSTIVQIFSAYLMSTIFENIDPVEFIIGLRTNFHLTPVYQALIKSVIFSILISTISSFVGYHTKGGALELGKMTTKAASACSVATLLANYFVVQSFS